MTDELHDVLCSVITVSDRASRGEREDTSGKAIADALKAAGADVEHTVVSDGVDSVLGALRASTSTGARVVITTGGTGIAPRDFTPEATASIIARPIPGIPEMLRRVSGESVPTAALSRGIAGVTGGPITAIIINLPGSLDSATAGIETILPLLPHMLSQLDGGDH
ncbi:MogA/MoaB family molybdenum cofactor biosynthesis protein [Demequina oxidasica]|uniref:MogA/MoaB family molybdenum cofactor biosynthesis protein n=1 Tax=Demequina oxidasica TaxID=676199 RepID=UPI0007803357|nr:MogA/MoaB family molybdenum cofactor biosynthesis protein [Demequina oxidasica]